MSEKLSDIWRSWVRTHADGSDREYGYVLCTITASLEAELAQAQADVEALSQGPWVVIEIGPLGFEQLLVRLETDRDNISTHYEGQVLAFAFSAGDMSKAFNTAWKDGRAIEKLRLTLATPRSSPAGG